MKLNVPEGTLKPITKLKKLKFLTLLKQEDRKGESHFEMTKIIDGGLRSRKTVRKSDHIQFQKWAQVAEVHRSQTRSMIG